MRDQGLSEAIRAAGSVTELARRLGISQPSVSNWTRIPAERVASVEAVTGVDRVTLRPDLFILAAAAADEDDDVDAARAREYALLATLLDRAPDSDILSRLGTLRGDAPPLGVAHAALAEAASRADAVSVGREFFDLFIGVGRGEVLPYGSYYLTGFLYERPLARLREDLAALGIVRAEDQKEPEDHAAIVCEIMSALVAQQFDTPHGADRDVFVKHVAPWLPRLFADIERCERAQFYRHVGTLGRVFLEIEAEAFALPS